MLAYRKWLALSTTEKLEIFNAIAQKMNIPAATVEKDWWVTQTLHQVFEMDCSPHLVFKGGTSLSKAWG